MVVSNILNCGVLSSQSQSRAVNSVKISLLAAKSTSAYICLCCHPVHHPSTVLIVALCFQPSCYRLALQATRTHSNP